MRNSESGKTTGADVIVIGAGVIGLAIARELARRKFGRVIVIERSRPGCEASNASAGMLAAQVDAGHAGASLSISIESRDMYPEFAAELMDESLVDIELDQTGTLLVATTEEQSAALQRAFEWQLAREWRVELLSGDEVRRLEPALSPHIASALRFPLDAQVENRKLTKALLAAAQSYGVTIFSDTAVEGLKVEADKVRGVTTARGDFYSPIVVIANGAWASQLGGVANAPRVEIEPIRGQILCFQTDPPLTKHVVFGTQGYLVPRRDGRLLAGSTSESVGFVKEVTEEGIRTVTANAVDLVPSIASLSPVESWSGLRPHSADDLPVLGRTKLIEGLIYATGHYRAGILLAPITGRLIADSIINGRDPSELEPFSPDRFQTS